jgi:hypothetical protein
MKFTLKYVMTVCQGFIAINFSEWVGDGVFQDHVLLIRSLTLLTYFGGTMVQQVLRFLDTCIFDMEFHCSKLYLCDSHDIAVKLLKVTINNKNPALNQVLRLDEFGATVQSPH